MVLFDKTYLTGLDGLFFRSRSRVAESGHAVNDVAGRDLQFVQNFTDGRVAADILELVDPNGADAKGVGRQEDILQGAGIVLLAVGAG